MRRSNRGVTLIEVMLALSTLAILTAIGVPSMRETTARARVQSGRSTVAALIGRARSMAIQRGTPTELVLSGGTMSISVDSAGTRRVLAAVDVTAEHRVSLGWAAGRISFNARGVSVGAGGAHVIHVSVASARDSLCITRVGHVQSQGCVT
ncbi:MAG: pilus assembly FimT family protein [Gemmatimonadaceae bacterium]